MAPYKLSRKAAARVLTLLALAIAAWWGWHKLSRPWGVQNVSFTPADQQCAQAGQLRYCVHRAAGGVNGDVVYHLHGRKLEAEIWNDPSYFTAMVQRYPKGSSRAQRFARHHLAGHHRDRSSGGKAAAPPADG
jgi:hypothetical protein